MKPIATYYATCSKLSVPEFTSQYPGPFLVHSSRSGGALQPTTGGLTIDGLVLGEEGPGPDAEQLTVFSVTPLAVHNGAISVGSDRGCHLRIAAASISRLHAVFRRDGDRWLLEDAGSSAGTWVNGSALEARASRALGAGDHVSLGVLDFTFLPPADFHAFVMACRPG